MDRLKAIFRVPINAIIDTLNGLISGINQVISALNSIHFGFPDDFPIKQWAGVSLGFNIGKVNPIPHLANGAVIPPNSQFLAMLGDQKSGTNIEAPLDTIKQAVSEVIADQNINVNFGGTMGALIRVLNPKRVRAIMEKAFRTG